MKRYSILGGFIFGLLIFSFVQNVPLASAAQGDIGGIIENLEFDTTFGLTPDIIQISGDTFAVVYEGNGDDVLLKTFTVQSDGTSLAIIDSTGDVDLGVAATPKIIHVAGTVYLIIYEDAGAIHAATWNITNGGVTTQILAGAQIAGSGIDPDIIRISAQSLDPQIYAIAYRNTGAGFGDIQTISVEADGDPIAMVANLGTFAETANDIEIVRLGAGEAAVAYRTDAAASVGTVRIIDISDTGTPISIAGTPATITLNGGTAISASSDLDFVHVTGDVYAVAWSDGTDGKIETLLIASDGNSLSATTSASFQTTNVRDPALLQTDLGSTPFAFLVAYQDLTNLDGVVKSFTITNTGAISGIIDTVTFDTFNGKTPSLAHRTGNFYAVAYQGTGTGGFVSSFSIGTADTTAPSTTGAITINEVTTGTGDDDFAKSGDSVIITFTADEQIQTPTVAFPTLTGAVTIANTAGNTWTATIALQGGDTDGLVTFTINFDDLSGNSSTQKTQSDITDSSSVTADLTLPTVTNAAIVGDGDLNIVYSEIVISTATAHYSVDWPDSSGASNPSGIFGSGTTAILLVTATSDPEGNDAVDYSITSGVLDRAGNALSAVSEGMPSIAGVTTFVQPVLTSTNSDITLPQSTLITTITATAVAPEINLLGLAGAGGTATFPAVAITVDTATADILFPASVIVAGLPADEIIEVSVSTKTATGLPSGEVAGTIIELGDPNDDTITFSAPVKVTLPGEGGNTPFIVTNTVTVLVNACTEFPPTTTTLTSNVATNDASHCFIVTGSDLEIWTRHFTGFGSSSTPTSTGGGGSSSDSTPPSITVGFEQNEFPLRYDGVNYQSQQLDSPHTAMIKTGEELKATLTLYENSGSGNIQHVEMYVHQFGSQILNDLSETIVIYDGQSGLEIIDPYDLITTANVIPSISGNKAVFDFVVVFENEFPTSDVLFRTWDIKRNSVQLHLPDALKVEISEQSSNIISVVPESEVSDTEPESESIVPEAAPEVPEAAPEISEPVPGISEPTPEVELPTKTWTSGQLSVLKAWGGYDTETASDLDVLSKFGIKGEKIPSHFKQLVAWILNDQISQEEFVNALQYLKREGMLSNSVGKQSFDVPSQKQLEDLTLEKKFFDDTMKFEFDENNLIKANFDDLENKVRMLRALANNEVIQNELARSNMEFNELEDPVSLIVQRDSEWTHNPKIVTPFMDSLMNNESALIAKAIIENDAESLVPLISIVITNTYGVNVIITEKTQDYNQSDESWWSKTKSDSVHIMSGSGSEQQSGLYTAEVSTIINDSEGNFIGIIKAVVNFEKALLSD